MSEEEINKPTPAAPAETRGSLESLLEENLALTKEIYRLTEKTRRYLFYGQIFNLAKIVLIVGPLVAATLYLLPFLRQAVDFYASLLGGAAPSALAPAGPPGSDLNLELKNNFLLKRFLPPQ